MQPSTLPTLQHTATHCDTRHTRQHTVTHCDTRQHTATLGNTLQHTAVHYDRLQHTFTHTYPPTGQHTATEGNTLQQNTATHVSRTYPPMRQCTPRVQKTCRSTLQHTATHCNTTLQHTFLTHTFLQGTVPRAFKYLSKQEILQIPIIGWAMQMAGHIGVRSCVCVAECVAMCFAECCSVLQCFFFPVCCSM